MFILTFYLFVIAAVWHRFGCSLFHKSGEIRQIRNAVNIFNPILSAFYVIIACIGEIVIKYRAFIMHLLSVFGL